MYIELRHLRSIRAIASEGSLAGAARRLYLTESALSHQIKSLERHFEVELFFRRHRPLRLTPAGELLLSLARRLLDEAETAEAKLRELAGGGHGRLHVAMECHSCFQWLLPTMDRYRNSWPQVELDLSAGYSFHPLPALLRGDVDLVVTSDPEPDLRGIDYHPLFRHEVRLAVHRDSPLAGRGAVTPSDLAADTLITYPVCRERLDVFGEFLTPAGVQPAAVRTAELTAMIVQLVASRRGVAALPNWVIAEHRPRGDIADVALGKGGLWRTLFAAVREEDRHSPYMQAFLTEASSVSRELLTGILSAEPAEGDVGLALTPKSGPFETSG